MKQSGAISLLRFFFGCIMSCARLTRIFTVGKRNITIRLLLNIAALKIFYIQGEIYRSENIDYQIILCYNRYRKTSGGSIDVRFHKKPPQRIFKRRNTKCNIQKTLKI